MKLVPPDQRRAISAVRLSLALAAIVMLPLLLYAAPVWWSQRNVLVQNTAPDDYAPANHGQLKNIARAAAAEMDAKLPGGAGDKIHALINTWLTPTSQTNDFATVNLGQLKNVAKPFYDRLIAAGLAARYPWTNVPNQSDDFAIANVGQVKNLFSFDLPAVDPLYDGDNNGLPDLWEQQYFGHTGTDPNADFDGDGISNLQEYRNHSDPTDFFNGTLDTLTISGGGDQRGDPGTLLPVPVSVRVGSMYSGVVWNAPITVSIDQGAAHLVPDNSGITSPSTTLALGTNVYDNEGYPVALFYVLLPPNPDLSIIRISAKGGTRSLSVFTSAVAIDPSFAAPTNFSVIATSASTAKLTWTAAAESLPTTIQASIDDGRTWVTVGTVATGVSQVTVTGLNPNHVTKFRLFAGGTPSDNNSNSFILPDPSLGPPPRTPPGPNGGGAGDWASVVPLALPVVEVDQAEFEYGIKGGYLGMKPNTPGSFRLYKNKKIVATIHIPKTEDSEEYDGSTTQTFAWIPGNESFGRGDREVTSTSVTGEFGGALHEPFQTVIWTDSVLRWESKDFLPVGAASSKTITLSNPYTDADAEAAGAAANLQFYGEFYELGGSDLPAYFSHGHENFNILVAKYRFRVNADPNFIVQWDVEFTPENGGPVQHDIQSWHADGSTYSPEFLLDPRKLNHGQNGTYRIIPISAELMVDANRDGEMSFDDPAIHYANQTSEERPYRFWLNDDDDGAAGDQDDHIPPTAPDYADGVIRSIRDLEDFSRLHVNLAGLEEAIESGSIKAAFEWRQTSGDPRIKLYRASKPGLDYLINESVASALTLTPFRETLGEVTVGAPLFPPPAFWSRTSPFANVPKTLPVAWFLFEASREGKGELVISFWKDGQRVGETSGVWLELKNVKRLFQRAKGTPLNGVAAPWSDDSPLPTDFVDDPNGYDFEQSPDESNDLIIFVHGIHPPFFDENSSYLSNINSAETVYKRLWHGGYKGRFAFYKWPALNPAGYLLNGSGFEFNQSEYRGFKYGRGLARFAASFPVSFNKHIYAHSQGNAVAAAAFQNYGLRAKAWIATQGAIPISCFDDSLRHYVFNYVTPDSASDLGYRGFLDNQVKTRIVNFCNDQDTVTGKIWELNHEFFKPTVHILGFSRIEYWYFSNPSEVHLRQFLGDIELSDRGVNDPHESMAMVAKSRSRSIAHGIDVQGKVDEVVDLHSAFSFGDQHGSQWENPIQRGGLRYFEKLVDETR
jgi:hypothetical protein